MRRSLVFISLFLFCCDPRTHFVKIQTSSGRPLSLKVEVADSFAKREKGLMFRQHLAEGSGMIFVFPSETLTSFWMKDTPIPLDILFIRGVDVVDVIENASPFSQTLLTPRMGYDKALEVPGGYAAKMGIRVGDRVLY